MNDIKHPKSKLNIIFLFYICLKRIFKLIYTNHKALSSVTESILYLCGYRLIVIQYITVLLFLGNPVFNYVK